jgi:spermidine synthase
MIGLFYSSPAVLGHLMRALALLFCAWATAATAQGPSSRIVHQASSPFYDSIFVVDEGDLRSLRFSSASGDRQSVIRLGHPEQLPMPYLRAAAVGLAVPTTVQRMLMIGLGGGAFANFAQAHIPNIYIDAVEIDPVVAKIAQDYFAVLVGEKLKLHIMDAVQYVQQSHQPYDYILLDAYDADQIPEALVTSTFFRAVRKNLASGGVAVANLAISSDRKSNALIRKLADHFNYCLHLRSPPRYNDIVLLSQQPLPVVTELSEAALRFEAASATELDLERYAQTAGPCLGIAR